MVNEEKVAEVVEEAEVASEVAPEEASEEAEVVERTELPKEMMFKPMRDLRDITTVLRKDHTEIKKKDQPELEEVVIEVMMTEITKENKEEVDTEVDKTEVDIIEIKEIMKYNPEMNSEEDIRAEEDTTIETEMKKARSQVDIEAVMKVTTEVDIEVTEEEVTTEKTMKVVKELHTEDIEVIELKVKRE